MCSFVWKHLFYVRLIFFMFWGKNPYFIKKSHIRPFDSASAILSIARNVVSLEILLMILVKGSL